MKIKKKNWGEGGPGVGLGVRGLIFALKHRLCALVRTVSMIYVLSKNKKNIKFFHLKITIFTALKNHSVLH